ncbi:MAG: PKD domain-containing protein [Candidatus Thermoplasmatota archaeon]
MKKAAKIFGLVLVGMLLASTLSIVSIGNVESKGIRTPEEGWLVGYVSKYNETGALVPANNTFTDFWLVNETSLLLKSVMTNDTGYYNITLLVGNWYVLVYNETQKIVHSTDPATVMISENAETSHDVTLTSLPASGEAITVTFLDWGNITATRVVINNKEPFLTRKSVDTNNDGNVDEAEVKAYEATLTFPLTETSAVFKVDGVFYDINATPLMNLTFGLSGRVTSLQSYFEMVSVKATANASIAEAASHTIELWATYSTESYLYSYAIDLSAIPKWRFDSFGVTPTPNLTVDTTAWTVITVTGYNVAGGGEWVNITVIKDEVAPVDIVTNLATQVVENNVTLTWTGVNITLVPDFKHYKIYWNDDVPITDLTAIPEIQTATTTATTYTVPNLAHGRWYFAVTTVDAVGNENITLVTASALINRAPIANFTISAPEPYRGKVITFNASVAVDPDGDALNYTWNISGVIKYELEVTHTFTDLGTFNVTLTVKDIYDASSEKTLSVTIENQAPTASFTVSALEVVVGEEITFTSTSTDPENDALTYLWNFGDGTTSPEASPKHKYEKAGTYDVTLRVTDEHGATRTSTVTTITVKEKAPVVEWYYIVAIIIIIIIIIAIAAAIAKKKKKPEVPSE